MQIAECFEILNVSPGEEWPSIRKSYHSLARQLHPDINQGKDNTNFSDTRLKEINQAFAKLETYYKANVNHPEHYAQDQVKWRSFFKVLTGNPVIKEICRSGLNLLEDLDNKIFQLDIQQNIQLSESILRKGGSLSLKLGKECFEVKIPPGDWNNMSLKISGKGESSLFSPRRGDLLLSLRVPISKTARPAKPESSSFSYEMKILAEKINNRRTMTLNSSEGPIKFILPRNTRDGQRFTLRSNTGTETLHVLTVRLG
jgi:DnaJ-class molecular chaperone